MNVTRSHTYAASMDAVLASLRDPEMTAQKYRNMGAREVEVLDCNGDANSMRVESSRVSGMVIAFAGPWKSGGDWWHHGQQWERSEWDVELLHLGVFRIVETEREWVLEGYYD